MGGALGVLLSPWLLTCIAASVIAFYASARGLQIGPGVEVIAITSVAANLEGADTVVLMSFINTMEHTFITRPDINYIFESQIFCHLDHYQCREYPCWKEWLIICIILFRT